VATQTTVLTIPAGQSLSGAVDTSNALSLYLITPAQWDAANITFQASVDAGANFFDVFTADGEAMMGMSGRLDTVNPLTVNMPKDCRLKLRSGTRASPIAQQQDRQFTIVVVT
jgi:hypothetical protein